MALQFTHLGKGIVLRNLFSVAGIGGGISGFGYPAGATTASNTSYIHFFGGTRPDISTLPTAWQGTAYTGTTKLWPQSTSLTSITTGMLAANTQSGGYPGTLVDPTTLWTVDWTNQIITTSSSTLATNLLFAQGTVTWFAMYGGIGSSTMQLILTGSVGTTGSGADIEINSTTIPSNNYPVELKRMSFQFAQPTGVDLIFSKNIYTTALLNMFGSGVNDLNLSGNHYYLSNFTTNANAKYTWNGSGANRVLLYSGTRPASPDVAVPGDNTLIATIDTFGMSVTGTGQAAASNFTTYTNTSSETSLAKTGVNYIGTASATGTPTWARVLVTNSGSTAAFDCSAGLTSAGTAAIQINEAPTVVGQQINLTSMKFTMA